MHITEEKLRDYEDYCRFKVYFGSHIKKSEWYDRIKDTIIIAVEGWGIEHDWDGDCYDMYLFVPNLYDCKEAFLNAMKKVSEDLQDMDLDIYAVIEYSTIISYKGKW